MSRGPSDLTRDYMRNKANGFNNIVQAVATGMWVPLQLFQALYNMPGVVSVSVRASSEYGMRLSSLCADLGMKMKYNDPYIVPCTQLFKFKQYKALLIDNTDSMSYSESSEPTPGGRFILAFPTRIDLEEFKRDVFNSTKPTNTLVIKTYNDGWKGKRKPYKSEKQPLSEELEALLVKLETSPKVLLYGAPGTGKTTFGKHAAHHYSRDLALISNTVGFDKALSELGTDDVVLLEDIDILLAKDPDIQHALMQFLDGVLSNEEQIIICTTNNIDLIPKPLMRPGRFTEYLELGNITEAQLRKICNINNWNYDDYAHAVGKNTLAEVVFGEGI